MSFEQAVAEGTQHLDANGVAFRVIGAAALAAHGISRSTRDLDLLIADREMLLAESWRDVAPPGFLLEVRVGEPSDPLLGVIRVEEDLEGIEDWDHVPLGLDVVAVRGAWVKPMLDSEGPFIVIGETTLQAVTALDLVLLKLYAGGARDAWDITSLVQLRPALVASIDSAVEELPAHAVALWTKIRGLALQE